MNNLLNQLQISTNCQTLHPRIKHYLKLITRTPSDSVLRRANEMEGKLLDGGQNRDQKKNFIFTSSELTDNLEDKASVLKGLLSKFHSLPEQCKPRALPLKEYIEHHLQMLNNMLAEEDSRTERTKIIESYTEHRLDLGEQSNVPQEPLKLRSVDKTTTEPDMFTINSEKALIEEQLENVGLGENPNYRPNFDLDAIIAQNRHRKDTRGRGVEQIKKTGNKAIRKRHSESYEKLLNAIAKEKMRKIRESRLGQIYGKFNNDLFNFNEKAKRDANNFESPLVYSF